MEPWLNPLYDAGGMRGVDRWAIEEMGVPSLELMEAAGRAVAEVVGEMAPEGPVRVVCGKGSNAGDGLVAARYLREAGFEVEALLLWPGEELSGDAATSLARFPAEHVGGDLAPRLAGSGGIVDAIFGTGFSGPPREPSLAAVEAINACGAPVVACDIANPDQDLRPGWPHHLALHLELNGPFVPTHTGWAHGSISKPRAM